MDIDQRIMTFKIIKHIIDELVTEQYLSERAGLRKAALDMLDELESEYNEIDMSVPKYIKTWSDLIKSHDEPKEDLYTHIEGLGTFLNLQLIPTPYPDICDHSNINMTFTFDAFEDYFIESKDI